MLNDEIVDEVRAVRHAHAAQFNYDLRAIYDDLKKSGAAHLAEGHAFVEPPLRQFCLTLHCSGLASLTAEFKRWAS